MSWMLLGMANDLAYELGILSNQQADMNQSPDLDLLRCIRAQKLLYVYLTQTATRIGYPSVFPREHISHCISSTSASPELTQLSRTASSMFFHSAAHLQTKVLGDHYVDLLEHFNLSLFKWQNKFNTMSKDITEPLRDTLSIEFHHIKACTSVITIQAVVVRASSAGFTAATTDPDETLSAFITPKDAKFLQEVISDTKKVLHTATMSNFIHRLPYAPARVKISVISSSVFLIKALSIGSTHTDVNGALHMLDQCTSALKSSPADDMDFALSQGENVTGGSISYLSSLDSEQLDGGGNFMNFEPDTTFTVKVRTAISMRGL
ncbi:aro80-positive transcription regulator of aro9 and aro10 [Fusarium sporotrichioides]|uniref:Aro80-positive transcription regulator of aro9 and aro10 n=1 Tax=Fusarium sporotrichioides TaxID=5514 RepID=A0A395RBM3_FUSSP|nr:aro80-positive transcription regulator of aro9 and aro10 [Fusarium sporotrichioides]